MSAARPLGAILAGGQARRLGGRDKMLVPVAGRTILSRIIGRLAPQCGLLVINANADPSRLSGLDLPIVPDDIPGFAGPLAGVLAVLDWAAREQPGSAHVVTVPGDAPFLPRDLVARLGQARTAEAADIACAASGGRLHPVAALWPVSLRADLRAAVTGDGVRKVAAYLARHRVATVAWAADEVDPFFNVNTPQDVAEAERLCARHPDL